MREVADAERIRRFMRVLGVEADADGRVYLAGGATAVLLGWRLSTIDVDIKIVPEQDQILRALPHIKEELRINIELASPADFIPVPAGWEERSPFVAREGRLSFHHFDLYAQVLAKIQRGHARDIEDVQAMIGRRLIEPGIARGYYQAIEPDLYRFPAIDPRSFRAAVDQAFS